jgi:phosphatidylglycerol:prolipoprotein diacylglycerol transferase
MHPYFTIFGTQIPAYGTMALIGFLVSLFAAVRLGRHYGIKDRDIFCAACYGVLGLIIGAKLFYALPFLPEMVSVVKEHGFSYLSEHSVEFLRRAFAGYVFYGGLLGIMSSVAFYAKMMRMNVRLFLDVLAMIVPLFHGFGRIGCFLAGCCYGVSITATVRFPVQLIESICNFLLFVFLVFYGKKEKNVGKVAGIYLMVYPLLRFLLEFFRGDRIRGVWTISGFQISSAQFISIPLFFFGYVLCTYPKCEREKKIF